MFPSSAFAGVAQLVEHFLAKEDVARSNRVTRSIFLDFGSGAFLWERSWASCLWHLTLAGG